MLAACLGTLGIAPRALADAACQAIPIDPQGAYTVSVQGINNWGQVVGTRNFADPYRIEGFVWQNGRARVLPSFDQGRSGMPMAINDLGQIVGYSWRNGEVTAALWTNGGATITALPGGELSFPSDINNVGQIVGSGLQPVGGSTCLLWPSSRSAPTVLTGPSGNYCSTRAINDLGEIVGTVEPGAPDGYGFVWKDGIYTPIVVRDPNDATRIVYTELMDINNAGVATGFADVVINYTKLQTIVWTRPQGVRLLPFAAGSQNIDAWGTIYATGQSDNATHLYLANARGQARDRGTLGEFVSVLNVWANDRFQIAWTAVRSGSLGDYDAFFCQLR